jgi:inhibitor of cysteine peptidase
VWERVVAELHFSSVDNNKRATVKVGDEIIISLPQNATTGFKWDPLSHTTNTLTFEGKQVAPATTTTPGAGGGPVAFRYRVVAPGEASIVLKLWRGSEADAQVFKYTLTLDASN